MSEEKLYAVKNDEGEYLDSTPRWNDKAGTAFKSSATTLAWAKIYDGHVVTLIEEPKKVVLTKEEAKILDRAKTDSYPANYISMNAHPDPGANGTSYEELRLMRALVNGYTVAKEKKYRVITPKSWWASENEPEYMHMNVLNGIENYKGADDDTVFTQKQLDLYELNGAPFTKEEVTDDDD